MYIPLALEVIVLLYNLSRSFLTLLSPHSVERNYDFMILNVYMESQMPPYIENST